MTFVIRVIVETRPGTRLTNLKFDEFPRRGDVVTLPDGTHAKIKKIKAAKRGEGVAAIAYATPA